VLLKYERPSDTSLVICQSISKKSFTMFGNYIEYGKYYLSPTMRPSHQCFFELIPGNHLQKPYFDIDIHLLPPSMISIPPSGGGGADEDSEEGVPVLSVEDAELLCSQILENIPLEFPGIKQQDIIVCTSHSAVKRSYHIIVDNWCLLSHEDNRCFFNKVRDAIAKTNPRLTHPKIMDNSVYKSVQQLRILGCHKWESDRVKIIDHSILLSPSFPILTSSPLKGEEDRRRCLKKDDWEPPVKPKNQAHLFMMQLAATLVTNIGHCAMLPSLYTPPDNIKYEGFDLSESEIKESLKLFNNECYTFRKASKNRIDMKRIKPDLTKCLLCKRKHDNIDCYLIVNNQYQVHYYCYLASSARCLLGAILSPPEMIQSMPSLLSASPSSPIEVVEETNGAVVRRKNAPPSNDMPLLPSSSPPVSSPPPVSPSVSSLPVSVNPNTQDNSFIVSSPPGSVNFNTQSNSFIIPPPTPIPPPLPTSFRNIMMSTARSSYVAPKEKPSTVRDVEIKDSKLWLNFSIYS
jgi:hypothetical protein